ncbi:uncharacterized protein LOC136031402 isoform X3 [Artemia franciscana]|uniref:uncharacterized protein LOC136031402 isoform X3 n=1 Tax=Artemia franciscana TaxID=6661 RepID=UPI0032DA324A
MLAVRGEREDSTLYFIIDESEQGSPTESSSSVGSKKKQDKTKNRLSNGRFLRRKRDEDVDPLTVCSFCKLPDYLFYRNPIKRTSVKLPSTAKLALVHELNNEPSAPPPPELEFTDLPSSFGAEIPLQERGKKENKKTKEDRKSLFASILGQGDAKYKKYDAKGAQDCYTRALEIQPGDKVALVARSRCKLQLGDIPGSLEDVDKALEADPYYIKALHQKGEALFENGDFENALVYYQTGRQYRPEMECFIRGIKKAQQAIEAALGIGPWAPNRTPKKRGQSSKNLMLPPRSVRNSKSWLGELDEDRVYLENVLRRSKNQQGENSSSTQLVAKTQEALDYLKTRENFWKLQRLPPPPKILKKKVTKKSKNKKRNNETVSPQKQPETLCRKDNAVCSFGATSSDEVNLKLSSISQNYLHEEIGTMKTSNTVREKMMENETQEATITQTIKASNKENSVQVEDIENNDMEKSDGEKCFRPTEEQQMSDKPSDIIRSEKTEPLKLEKNIKQDDFTKNEIQENNVDKLSNKFEKNIMQEAFEIIEDDKLEATKAAEPTHLDNSTNSNIKKSGVEAVKKEYKKRFHEDIDHKEKDDSNISSERCFFQEFVKHGMNDEFGPQEQKDAVKGTEKPQIDYDPFSMTSVEGRETKPRFVSQQRFDCQDILFDDIDKSDEPCSFYHLGDSKEVAEILLKDLDINDAVKKDFGLDQNTEVSSVLAETSKETSTPSLHQPPMVQVRSLASEKNCNPLPPQVTVVTVEAEVHVINPTYLELNIESSIEEMQKAVNAQDLDVLVKTLKMINCPLIVSKFVSHSHLVEVCKETKTRLQLPLSENTEKYTLIQAGLCLMEAGKLKEAKKYTQCGLELSVLSKDKEMSIFCCLLIAVIHGLNGNFDKASDRIIHARQIFEMSRIPSPEPNSHSFEKS